MESIDRLRDWLKGRLLMGNGWNELNEIADAIEREVKANRVDAYTKGYDEGFASADDLAAQHEDAMAGHGWVRLPLDADGVPIHVGDVMEWPDCSTAEVVGIGNDTFFYVEDGEDAADWSCASDKIHHHTPTVEDVLREFAEKMNENLGMYTGEAIDADEWRDADADTIAEFAAKLRLAGDE